MWAKKQIVWKHSKNQFGACGKLSTRKPQGMTRRASPASVNTTSNSASSCNHDFFIQIWKSLIFLAFFSIFQIFQNFVSCKKSLVQSFSALIQPNGMKLWPNQSSCGQLGYISPPWKTIVRILRNLNFSMLKLPKNPLCKNRDITLRALEEVKLSESFFC